MKFFQRLRSEGFVRAASVIEDNTRNIGPRSVTYVDNRQIHIHIHGDASESTIANTLQQLPTVLKGLPK